MMKYICILFFISILNTGYTQNSLSENEIKHESEKFSLHIDPNLGVITNKTFGTHFSFHIGLSVGFKEKNKLGFGYEKLFGDSENEYQVFGDYEVFNTKDFGQSNYSLFYERLVLNKIKDQLSLNLGLCHDQIKIDSTEYLKEEKVLKGIGYEFRIGYNHIFKEKHSIPIELLYHISNFDNDGGSELAKDYIGLRLIYSYNGSI